MEARWYGRCATPVFYLKRQHVDSSSCRQPRRRRRRARVRSMRLEQQCRPVIIIIITIAVEPRYRPAGASQIGRPCAAGWVWYRHESSYERAWGPGIKPGTRAGLLGAKPKGPKHPSIRCSCLLLLNGTFLEFDNDNRGRPAHG